MATGVNNPNHCVEPTATRTNIPKMPFMCQRALYISIQLPPTGSSLSGVLPRPLCGMGGSSWYEHDSPSFISGFDGLQSVLFIRDVPMHPAMAAACRKCSATRFPPSSCKPCAGVRPSLTRCFHSSFSVCRYPQGRICSSTGNCLHNGPDSVTWTRAAL